MDYNKKPLTKSNIKNYIENKYGEVEYISDYRLVTDKRGYLQDNYGLRLDCTVTSMSEYICLTKTNLTMDAVYPVVETVAKRYGYNGEKTGTNPLKVNKILTESFNVFNFNVKMKSGYVKGLPFFGYNFKKIKKIIDCGNPIILNIFKDGREYYDDHSILIIGYQEVKLKNEKIIPLLIVHDNWSKENRYVDYNLLFISSINYVG